jgi:hypothetical protein
MADFHTLVRGGGRHGARWGAPSRRAGWGVSLHRAAPSSTVSESLAGAVPDDA